MSYYENRSAIVISTYRKIIIFDIDTIFFAWNAFLKIIISRKLILQKSLFYAKKFPYFYGWRKNKPLQTLHKKI